MFFFRIQPNLAAGILRRIIPNVVIPTAAVSWLTRDLLLPRV